MMPTNIPMRFDPIIDYRPEGTLVFYSIRPITDNKPNPCTSVWWKDKDSPQGFGPFSSLQGAFDHHRLTTKKMREYNEKPEAIVITYDFRTKKRL